MIGFDVPFTRGWGEYPLDSVFVRTDQGTVGEVVKFDEQDSVELPGRLLARPKL